MESDFRSCLYFSSNTFSRVLSEMADEAFGRLGLAPSYAFLLIAVNEEPGIRPSKLSGILGLTPSTVSRLVDKMEHQGYVERRSEGRSTHVEPTRQCQDRYPEILEAWQELQEGYTEKLGDRYTEVLTEMTRQALEQLDEK